MWLIHIALLVDTPFMVGCSHSRDIRIAHKLVVTRNKIRFTNWLSQEIRFVSKTFDVSSLPPWPIMLLRRPWMAVC
jgi:hypothetical protein